MRNNQVDMPPLTSLAGGHRRERSQFRASRPLETRSRLRPEPSRSKCQCDGTFAGIDSELVRAKPLVAAIAREICEVHGGNEVLNWLEAEILLENALSDFPDRQRGGEVRR